MKKSVELLKRIQNDLEELQKLGPEALPQEFTLLIFMSPVLEDGSISEKEVLTGLVGDSREVSASVAMAMHKLPKIRNFLTSTVFASEIFEASHEKTNEHAKSSVNADQ